MRKLSRILVLMLTSALLFLACRSQKNLFKDQDPVPADFGKEPATVLVFRTDQNKVNTALQNSFEKYYKGTFELIDKEDLGTEKYENKKKYRYYFRTYIKFVPASGMGQSRIPASYNYTYDVFDRVTNKKNGLDFYGGAYKGLMEAYVKKMEEIRSANAK